jgi:hypothetical protein
MRSGLEDKLFKLNNPDNYPEFKVQIFSQYTEFTISAQNEKANKSFRYEMLVKKVKTPYQFWLADGSQWPQLQPIALRIFSVATPTASCERSFSNQGCIHSKLRNSISTERVEKLVFIRANHPIIDEQTTGIALSEHSSSDDDSSEGLTD